MILAFTGTRRGMTAAQRAALPSVLAALPERVLHGGAIGADTEFDAFLAPLYTAGYPKGRPPLLPLTAGVLLDETAYLESLPIIVFSVGIDRWNYWRYEAAFPAIRRLLDPFDDPLARNRFMAQRCDALLATPATAEEELHSDTWATIRAARKAGKLITIIEPDGMIKQQQPYPWKE